MLNEPNPAALTKARHAPREGVFIPRKQVQKMRRASSLLDEARRRARDLIKAAEQQAVDIRRQAFASGYEEGALTAASQVLSHFDATQALAAHMRQELETHARTLLGAALDHPDSVLALLDQCLQGLAGPPDQRIRISLPATMRGVRGRLNALLENAGREAVDIDYRDDARLIVLTGEQVFEFDPPASIAQGQRHLLNRFTGLAAAYRGLGDQAMQDWHETFEQRFAAEENDDAVLEDDDPDAYSEDESEGGVELDGMEPYGEHAEDEFEADGDADAAAGFDDNNDILCEK